MEASTPNEMEQNIENELNTDENIPGTEHLNEPVTDEDPITKLEAELQEQKDKYLRLMAEFDNYKIAGACYTYDAAPESGYYQYVSSVVAVYKTGSANWAVTTNRRISTNISYTI
jgi:hypothetical protein